MNKYIKNNIEIKKDSIEWALLKNSAVYKKEHKKEQAEIEIIESYIQCMEVMCNQIKNSLREHIFVLYNYSLCIPYIFICRHLIELIIKRSIESRTNNVKNGHYIADLWKECKRLYEEKDLRYYDELIETIDMLDDNGEKFRYVKDKYGNEFENTPVFLNVELIKEDINKLKESLL